ncbi:MAG: VanZ family protein [Acidobacteria bacterium]|nr:VanZ family protein [Acidobacteriota bacterium]
MDSTPNFVQKMARYLFSHRGLATILLILSLDICTYAALSRQSGTMAFQHQDKVLHVLAFAFLFVLGYWVLNFDMWRKKYRLSFGLVVLNSFIWLGYGAFIEVTQFYLGYRSASVGDFLADLTGMVLGLGFLGLFRPFPSVVS